MCCSFQVVGAMLIPAGLSHGATWYGYTEAPNTKASNMRELIVKPYE